MPEPRPITLSPLGMSPEEIAARNFAVVRRGFEPDAVRRFLEDVAGQLRAVRAREVELHAALADAEQRAASPVLDDAALSAALGAETARVLQVAHEAAQEVVAKAEHRAEALLAEASTVHATRAAAAEAEASRLVDEGRRTVEDLVERTKTECRSMLDEAREARRRILEDLAGRRRDLHGQIEQLRAAKDALSAIFADAAGAVAEIQDRLVGSEDEAREAAGEVAAQHGTEGSPARALDATLLGLEPPGELDLSDFGDEFAPDEGPHDDDLVAEIASMLPPVPGPVAPRPVSPSPYEAAFDDEDEVEAFRIIPAPAASTEAVEVDAEGAEPEPAEPRSAEVLADEPVEAAEGDAGDEPVEAAAGGAAGDEPVGGEEAARAEPEPEAGGDGEETSAPEPPPAAAVDALFARIRASRAEEVARARAVLAEPEAAEAEAGERGDPSETGVGTAAEEEAAAGGGERDDGPVEPEGASLAQARDEAIEPIRVEVARALKRVLRSEQNELLDKARTLKLADAADLLAGDETAARLTEAVAPSIAAAWRSGREGAGAPEGEEGTGPSAEIAEGLAGEVVQAIEGRLSEGIASFEASGSAAEDGLGELVGVAYREWKGARIDAVAAEAVRRAHAAGSVAGAKAIGAKVRWAVDNDQPCPDCDDNALSEPLDPGAPFPTGQVQPPLHVGCRCVLVTVPG